MFLLNKLDKVLSSIAPFIDNRVASPISAAQETQPLFTPATFGKNFADDRQNDSALKAVAKNVAANVSDANPQTDSRHIFKQEIENANKQGLSKRADKTVRVVFSKPAEGMSYDDYTRDYLRAMLRENGVSKATDEEINHFQSLLKDATGGDGFGTEDKAEQAKMTERYRATQTKGGGEAYWGTSPQARAQVLAGAGAILRERAAQGAQLGAAQQIGQVKAGEMAADVLVKIPANVVIRTANDLKNTAIDVFAQQPSAPPIPAIVRELAKEKTNLPRLELKSEMMNRGLDGKVNKDANAITAGKTIEVAVELAAPIAISKATAPAKAMQELGLSKPSFGRVTPLGGRAVGEVSRREYDPDKIGIPIRNLSTENIKVTHRGIDFVEKHISRFDVSKPNQVMVERLRKIADGKIPATQQDLNFYSHELRESMRYKQLGFPDGQPIDADEARELWNNAHTSTLEEYRIKEKNSLTNDPLYHPDAAKHFFEDYK